MLCVVQQSYEFHSFKAVYCVHFCTTFNSATSNLESLGTDTYEHDMACMIQLPIEVFDTVVYTL
jgi:hypothetical protein